MKFIWLEKMACRLENKRILGETNDMKKRNKYLYITILLMFSLLLTTGCGEKEDKVTMAGTMETESPEVAQTTEEQVVEETDSSQIEKVNDFEEAEEVIHVSSTEEFLEAIAKRR